jgi:hypothetical protein
LAFIRFKGPYAYLVENERRNVGGQSRVRQRVLYYLGREPAIDDDVIAEVESRFPDAEVDWDALREQLAAGGPGPPRPPARRRKRAARPARPEKRDEWLEWD